MIKPVRPSDSRTPPAAARWTRRQVMVTGAAALATFGCKRSNDAEDPPRLADLPGPGDVDGKLSKIIPGKRHPATYDIGDPPTCKGAAKPLVTIVEFSDFQCPYCGQLATTMDELLAAYPEDLRVVFRQYPLPFHPQAPGAAKASLAAGRHRRFWAMHDRLFQNRAGLGEDDLVDHAVAVGVKKDAFESAIADEALATRIDAEMEHGRKLGVKGTPTMFINGLRVGGVLGPDKLIEVIDGERRVGEALMDKGSKREEVYARFMRAAGAR